MKTMLTVDVDKLLDNRPGTVPHDAILLTRGQLDEMISGAVDDAYIRIIESLSAKARSL